MMFETERLSMRKAMEEDINEIIYLEEHPENRDYLWIGEPPEHEVEINDPNHILYVLVEKATGETVGFALMRWNSASQVFELGRMAISTKWCWAAKK
jgi:hypothetical protein